MSSPDPPEPAALVVQEPASDLLDTPAAGPAALRGSLMRSGSYVAAILLSLVSAPLLIRHLGIAEFGRYSTIVAIVTVVGGLTDAGLLNIALREWVTRRGEERAEVMRSLLGVRLELSLAGVLLGTGFSLAAGYGKTLVLGTLLAGAGMLVQSVANLLTAPLQAELRFGWASMVDLARQAVGVALIVVLVLVGSSLLPFFVAPIPAGLAALALAIWLVHARTPLRPTLRGRHRWPLIVESIPFAAAVALNTLYLRVTIVVMSLIATARQTGFFATSFRVTEVLVGVPAVAISAAFPILTRSAATDEIRFGNARDRVVELALVGGCLLSLGVVLIAPFVIEVLAGPRGAPATRVLQIQGLALLPTFLSAASSFVLLAQRRQAAIMLANGGALLANIVLTLVLVPLAQARGAAVAAVVAESCLAVVQLSVVLRGSAMWRWIRGIPGVALAAAVGATPLLLDGVHPILRALAGCLLYVAALAVQGRLPPEIAHMRRQRDRGEFS